MASGHGEPTETKACYLEVCPGRMFILFVLYIQKNMLPSWCMLSFIVFNFDLLYPAVTYKFGLFYMLCSSCICFYLSNLTFAITP